MISPGTLSHPFPRTNFKERFLCHPDCQECALIDLGVTTVATDTLSTDSSSIEVSSQQPVLFLWDECLAGCKNGCSSSGAMVSLFSKEIFSEHWKSLPAIEHKAFSRQLPHFDRDAKQEWQPKSQRSESRDGKAIPKNEALANATASLFSGIFQTKTPLTNHSVYSFSIHDSPHSV